MKLPHQHRTAARINATSASHAMHALFKIALVIGSLVIGGWLLPMLVCSLPGISDSLVCGHNFWILILPCALLGAIAAWLVVLRIR